MSKKLIPAAILCLVFSSCKHQSYEIPVAERKGDPSLCFERDILPIFVSECAKSGCHDAAEAEKGYRLDSYEHIVKKGIAPGNPIGSTIYRSLLGYTEKRMPEDAPPLSNEKIELVRRWIAGGAIEDKNCTSPCDSNNYTYSTGVQPLLRKYCYGCHTGSNPGRGLILATYDNVKYAVEQKSLIESINHKAGYQPMPNTSLKLSVCEIRQIERWVTAGMMND